jgi:hypothetical protein
MRFLGKLLMAATMNRAGENHDFDKEVILRVHLAIKRGSYREAEIMIMIAMLGNPPATITSELRELLIQVASELQRAARD